jgi:hypothetical protein
VKCQKLLAIIVLGILTGMPGTVFSRSSRDSLLLERIFNYRRNFTTNDVYGFTTNVYIKQNYNVHRRNVTLWLVPSMYSIADGERYLVAESYNKLRFNNVNDYESHCQVSFSNIRHNRRAMPVIRDFLTPNIYEVCMYDDHVLSPFNRYNRHYYQYRILPGLDNTMIVEFRPRLFDNTQLVTGEARVDASTGRIIKATMKGEFDMIRFRTETTQGEHGARSLLPKTCRTNVQFKFIGNKISSVYDAVYDCPVTLPDSLDDVFDLTLMDSVRPIPLTAHEDFILHKHAERYKPDTTQVADTVRKFNFVKDVLQNAIGDNLISSIRYESEHANMKLSPILNPQYVSYSSTHGLAYKLKFGAQYHFNAHRYFEFYPWCGYNFKYNKFYFTLPLYFNYNPKRNGQVQVIYGNGNRIGNGDVMDAIARKHGDSIDLDNQQLNYFDDYYLTVSNNVVAYDWLEINSGFTYHQRVPYNIEAMRKWGMPLSYNSFAPMLSLKFRPWHHGPVFTVDYERGVKGILKSDIDYERWEFDGSTIYKLKPLTIVNVKVGGGFYSRKRDSYFVDYMHFRDNKLPEGWGDDWSGDFQLLDSRWYNESNYYARANFSYESPFIFSAWLPLIGHYIEKERLYFSTLSIEHTRPYTELGYGVSTRLVSIGLFASFLRTHFQQIDCKFTFELFRRW